MMKLKAIQHQEAAMRKKRLAWLRGNDEKAIEDQPDEEPQEDDEYKC